MALRAMGMGGGIWGFTLGESDGVLGPGSPSSAMECRFATCAAICSIVTSGFGRPRLRHEGIRHDGTAD